MIKIILILILIIYLIILKKKNIEGFVIIQPLINLVKILDKIRKILVKVKKYILDKIKWVYDKLKKIKNGVKKLKDIKQKIKKMDKIKKIQKNINNKLKTEDGKIDTKGIFESINKIVKNKDNLSIKEKINEIIKGGPLILLDIILSPFKNIKDNLEIKNGILYILISSTIISIISQLIILLLEYVELSGNLLIIILLNILSIILISGIVIKLNYSNKYNKEIDIKRILSISSKLSVRVILNYSLIRSTPLYIVMEKLQQIPILNIIFNIKDSIIIGILYIFNILMTELSE